MTRPHLVEQSDDFIDGPEGSLDASLTSCSEGTNRLVAHVSTVDFSQFSEQFRDWGG
jgi:hypothetical protein